MKTKWIFAVAAGGLMLASGIAFARMGGDMSGHDPMQMMQQHMAQGSGMMHGPGMMHGGSQGAAPKGDQSASSLAFQAVNAKMHAAMDIAFTGNTDVDFVKGMIPHHEGAIDMAKIELAFGKDPETRKLAEAIIKAQEEEISWMKSWLQKKGQ